MRIFLIQKSKVRDTKFVAPVKVCGYQNFVTTTINDSRCSFYLRALSNERANSYDCTRFTSVRLSRQKFAVTRINYANCKFFPHNDK